MKSIENPFDFLKHVKGAHLRVCHQQLTTPSLHQQSILSALSSKVHLFAAVHSTSLSTAVHSTSLSTAVYSTSLSTAVHSTSLSTAVHSTSPPQQSTPPASPQQSTPPASPQQSTPPATPPAAPPAAPQQSTQPIYAQQSTLRPFPKEQDYFYTSPEDRTLFSQFKTEMDRLKPELIAIINDHLQGHLFSYMGTITNVYGWRGYGFSYLYEVLFLEFLNRMNNVEGASSHVQHSTSSAVQEFGGCLSQSQ
ncbi:hypothetical protein EMCRGX_G019358 [Ephydatia muelleri]